MAGINGQARQLAARLKVTARTTYRKLLSGRCAVQSPTIVAGDSVVGGADFAGVWASHPMLSAGKPGAVTPSNALVNNDAVRVRIVRHRALAETNEALAG